MNRFRIVLVAVVACCAWAVAHRAASGQELPPLPPPAAFEDLPPPAPLPSAAPLPKAAPEGAAITPPTKEEVTLPPELLPAGPPAAVAPAARVPPISDVKPIPAPVPTPPAPPKQTPRPAVPQDKTVKEAPRPPAVPTPASSPPAPSAVPPQPLGAGAGPDWEGAQVPAVGAIRAPAAPPIEIRPTPRSLAPQGGVVTRPIPAQNPAQPPAFRLIGPYRKPADPVPVPAPAPHVAAYNSPQELGPLAEPAPPLVAVAGPPANAGALQVDKAGPRAGAVGETLTYEVTVRNTGGAPVTDVLVEDAVPGTAQLVATEPAGQVRGNAVQWQLDRLNPGQEQRYTVRLRANHPGTWQLHTTASLRTTRTMQAEISGPSLDVRVVGAATATVGGASTFKIELANLGSDPLVGLVLYVKLGEGLIHQAGREIEAELTPLAPGARKIIDLRIEAVKPGPQAIYVAINRDGQRLAQGGSNLVVTAEGGKAALVLKKSGAQVLAKGQQAEYRLEVVNRGIADAPGVIVIEQLPPGLDFVAASDEGQYDESTRTVRWSVRDVRAGQIRAVGLKLRGTVPGEMTNRVTATAGDGTRVGLTAHLVVEEAGTTPVGLTRGGNGQ